MQLSPNPAMGNAVLELEMPATEQVSIMVADVTGRLVATLYHGSLEPGQHRFLIDAASLGNAGMYLVSVRSSDAIQVSKLLIQQWVQSVSLSKISFLTDHHLLSRNL